MAKKDWMSAVSAIAPTVATILGGPLVGTGVDILCRNLLDREPSGNEKKDLKAIGAAVLTGAPAIIEKLKAAEKEADALELDFAKINAASTEHARENADKESWMPAVITVMMLAGFFGLGGYMISGLLDLDGKVGVMAGSIFGYIASEVKQIVSFHFGSSAGSSKKNAVIEKLMARL